MKRKPKNKIKKKSNFNKLSLFAPQGFGYKRKCPLSGKHAPNIDYKNIKDDQNSSFKSKLLLTSSLLGILQSDPSNWLKLDGDLSSIDSKKVEKLIPERMIAKEVKDFEKADKIRDELDAMGVIIKDSSSGSEWTLKK